jgi:arylformamidase
VYPADGSTLQNPLDREAIRMKIVDLSLPIEEGMMTFPTHWHPVVEVTILGRHGIEGRETRKVVFGTHTGTHADAARHFVPNGGTIDQIPLDTLIGPAIIADFTGCRALQEIDVVDLKEKLKGKVPARLILRTGWSEHFGEMKFYAEYPFLSEKAAQWLVDQGVRLIAMDTPSPDNPAHSRGTAKDSPNHKVFLGAGVVLVEYVTNLKAISSSEVELIVLPLKLKGADGCPVRCVAIER